MFWGDFKVMQYIQSTFFFLRFFFRVYILYAKKKKFKIIADIDFSQGVSITYLYNSVHQKLFHLFDFFLFVFWSISLLTASPNTRLNFIFFSSILLLKQTDQICNIYLINASIFHVCFEARHTPKKKPFSNRSKHWRIETFLATIDNWITDRLKLTKDQTNRKKKTKWGEKEAARTHCMKTVWFINPSSV